jgi:hypothetical protein
MRFKPTRIVAAIAVIGAVAAGGAAFTAGTGQPTTQAVGYGATTVTGGSITGITYQISADGTDINTVTLTTTEDLLTSNDGSPATVYLDFNGSNNFPTGGDAACVITATGANAGKVVTCTPKTLPLTVASVTSEQIAITDANAAGSGNPGDTFS